MSASHQFGPWRIWFDPDIGSWRYQHADAESDCPGWLHGTGRFDTDCIREIIEHYEEALSGAIAALPEAIARAEKAEGERDEYAYAAAQRLGLLNAAEAEIAQREAEYVRQSVALTAAEAEVARLREAVAAEQEAILALCGGIEARSGARAKRLQNKREYASASFAAGIAAGANDCATAIRSRTENTDE